MSPRVSIIIPMYNVEAYIGECIGSLRGQTFGDFEALCVDSGSSDGTVAAAQQAAAGDGRFTFLTTGDNGQSVARNAALDVARGEFLLNLDSDDFYLPETLERLVGKADAESLDLLYFSAHTFYESAELARRNPEPQDDRPEVPGVFSGADMYVKMEQTGAFRPSACLYLVKRSLVEDAGLRFEEGIIHEDLLFTMQAVPLAARSAFLNEPFYRRRMRAGSTMTTQRGVRNVRGHLVAAKRMEGWIRANGGAYDAAFVDAYCARIGHTRQLVAQDVRALGGEEVAAFRDTLPLDERIELDLHGIAPAAVLGEVLDSTTFKAGRAIMAVPTAIKDRLTARK